MNIPTSMGAFLSKKLDPSGTRKINLTQVKACSGITHEVSCYKNREEFRVT